MRKRIATTIALIISVLSVCLVFAACGDPTDEPVDYSLEKTSVTLNIGETYQIAFNGGTVPSDVKYTSDTDGVSVNGTGLVTAIAPCTANVTVTVGGKELILNVTVAHKYALNYTDETLAVGDTLALRVVTTPDKQVSPVWSVSPATGVVTVDENGNVEAVGVGTAEVKATVDGKELTCSVTVQAEPVLYAYMLNHTKLTLEKGQKFLLELECSPNHAFDAEWESSDSNKVQITVGTDDDRNCTADARSAGTATVSVKVDGNIVASCDITVIEYVYTVENKLEIDYGDTTAKVTASVSPSKVTDFTYSVANDNGVITVNENGGITTVGVGTAVVTVKDGENVVGACEVKVNPLIELAETMFLHAGDSAALELTLLPEGGQHTKSFEVVQGTSIARVTQEGVVTALKNGKAVIKATVDGKVRNCTVTVTDVILRSYDIDELETDRNNPVSLSDGAEYWEQYIAHDEINHKKYDSIEEDIIDRTLPTVKVGEHYLPDYKAWIAWNGGASGSDCDCGQCRKSTQNGGDGGWTDDGTKAYLTGNGMTHDGTAISFDIKVFPGVSDIKIYAGTHFTSCEVKISVGGSVLQSKTFGSTVSTANVITATLDVKEATVVRIVLTATNTASNGFISLAGVSVSGDVYRLNKYSARLLPNAEETISVTENGAPFTEGVTFKSDDPNVATVDAYGKVKAVAFGTAVITVNANGRIRKFNVEVSDYEYSLDTDSVTLITGKTHQIVVNSNPVGSTAKAQYTSNSTGIATVSDTGLITAVAEGETTIDVKIGNSTLSVKVSVAPKVAVNVSNRSFVGDWVELTNPEVVYWEYYLYDEVTSPNGKTDLIQGNISGKKGEENSYGAFVNFADGSPKNNSYDDAAFRKYSCGSEYEFTVTVPIGHHEIRVYTGAWENTVNKTALYDGDKELKSVTLEKVSGGRSELVIFDTVSDETTELTLRITAQEGDNCRLMAIAIVDMSKVTQSATTVAYNENRSFELTGVGNSKVNLSETGDLDWIKYHVENAPGGEGDGNTKHIRKALGNDETRYIGDVTGINGNKGWDYKAAVTWNDNDGEIDTAAGKDGNLDSGAGHNNFVIADDKCDLAVKVDRNVKTVTLYVTAYVATYGLAVIDSNGNLLASHAVLWQDVNTLNDSRAFAVSFDISAEAEEELTFRLFKTYGANVGIAAVSVGG